MNLWKKLFGPRGTDATRADEINAAPKVDGIQDYSDSCIIRRCCQCGCQVWVNKLAPSNIRVCCMKCAEAFVRQQNKEAAWRFPFEE